MGPATALISPRRYSNLGAVGGKVLELITQPSTTDKDGETATLPLLQPRERHHAMRDSVSTDAGEDSASTSVIMDSEYVVVDNHTNTIVHPSERIDEPPLPAPPERTGY